MDLILREDLKDVVSFKIWVWSPRVEDAHLKYLSSFKEKFLSSCEQNYKSHTAICTNFKLKRYIPYWYRFVQRFLNIWKKLLIFYNFTSMLCVRNMKATFSSKMTMREGKSNLGMLCLLFPCPTSVVGSKAPPKELYKCN